MPQSSTIKLSNGNSERGEIGGLGVEGVDNVEGVDERFLEDMATSPTVSNRRLSTRRKLMEKAEIVMES
jgi:hypothetical protein